MKYEILGEPLPVVVCHLEGGESMITERGSMVWMSPNMKMETGAGGIGKAFGRMFSGDSIFQNTYTAQGGPGMIAFGSSFPGSIRAIEVDPAHPVVVQKSGFLASEQGVELSIFFQKKLGAGVFGGEGFIMQKLSGHGTAFVELDGSAVEYELQAGESMVIDSGNLAMMDATCRPGPIPQHGEQVSQSFLEATGAGTHVCRHLTVMTALAVRNAGGCAGENQPPHSVRSPRQPASTSLHVASKSPVYQGSATSWPGRPEYSSRRCSLPSGSPPQMRYILRRLALSIPISRSYSP